MSSTSSCTASAPDENDARLTIATTCQRLSGFDKAMRQSHPRTMSLTNASQRRSARWCVRVSAAHTIMCIDGGGGSALVSRAACAAMRRSSLRNSDQFCVDVRRPSAGAPASVDARRAKVVAAQNLDEEFDRRAYLAAHRQLLRRNATIASASATRRRSADARANLQREHQSSTRLVARRTAKTTESTPTRRRRRRRRTRAQRRGQTASRRIRAARRRRRRQSSRRPTAPSGTSAA